MIKKSGGLSVYICRVAFHRTFATSVRADARESLSNKKKETRYHHAINKISKHGFFGLILREIAGNCGTIYKISLGRRSRPQHPERGRGRPWLEWCKIFHLTQLIHSFASEFRRPRPALQLRLKFFHPSAKFLHLQRLSPWK